MQRRRGERGEPVDREPEQRPHRPARLAALAVVDVDLHDRAAEADPAAGAAEEAGVLGHAAAGRPPRCGTSSRKSVAFTRSTVVSRVKVTLNSLAASRLAADWPVRLRLTASTTCAPSRQQRSIAGMAVGGCCRSESITTTTSPAACSSPARTACSLPKLRDSCTPRTRSSSRLWPATRAPRVVGRAVVDQDQLVPDAGVAEHLGHPADEPLDAVALVVDRRDDREQRVVHRAGLGCRTAFPADLPGGQVERLVEADAGCTRNGGVRVRRGTRRAGAQRREVTGARSGRSRPSPGPSGWPASPGARGVDRSAYRLLAAAEATAGQDQDHDQSDHDGTPGADQMPERDQQQSARGGGDRRCPASPDPSARPRRWPARRRSARPASRPAPAARTPTAASPDACRGPPWTVSADPGRPARRGRPAPREPAPGSRPTSHDRRRRGRRSATSAAAATRPAGPARPAARPAPSAMSEPW